MAMHNFHLPLPEDVYRDLREEAARRGRPATALARQAIELWLRHRRKVARQEAIAAFAAENAGSSIDLDIELESASLEHLLGNYKDERRNVRTYLGGPRSTNKPE
jgi:plasmid stability protein